jgi:hypothetical protein
LVAFLFAQPRRSGIAIFDSSSSLEKNSQNKKPHQNKLVGFVFSAKKI